MRCLSIESLYRSKPKRSGSPGQLKGLDLGGGNVGDEKEDGLTFRSLTAGTLLDGYVADHRTSFDRGRVRRRLTPGLSGRKPKKEVSVRLGGMVR